LGDGHEARNTATLLVLSTHEIAGTFRRDQDDVEICSRLDELVVNVEPVGEQQRCALLQVRLDVFIELPLS
jgi:hypothetical protein